ncbi:hypothetical protein KS083_26235, partial [Klebsiella pneumoniae subsp. ozaenae]|nr:hypothetical protein [Klebsiella pneumoniae subsp. ozaenae]
MCPRTAAVLENFSPYMPPHPLQQIAGVRAFQFTTLYNPACPQDNHPQLLSPAHAWLFLSSLITHRLTGRFKADPTIAGPHQLLRPPTPHSKPPNP